MPVMCRVDGGDLGFRPAWALDHRGVRVHRVTVMLWPCNTSTLFPSPVWVSAFNSPQALKPLSPEALTFSDRGFSRLRLL